MPAKGGPPHYGIDVTPNGKYVLVTGIGGSVVHVIDTQKLEMVKKIEVGTGPHGLRTDADSRYTYVAVTTKNQLAKIDIKTLEIAEWIDIGQVPFWVAMEGNP